MEDEEAGNVAVNMRVSAMDTRQKMGIVKTLKLKHDRNGERARLVELHKG
jgi:hypothetical protein